MYRNRRCSHEYGKHTEEEDALAISAAAAGSLAPADLSAPGRGAACSRLVEVRQTQRDDISLFLTSRGYELQAVPHDGSLRLYGLHEELAHYARRCGAIPRS